MIQSLTLTQLEYLVAVDRFRSFARAADYCHVSQPALSQQIKKLELDLGVEAFDRTRQPVEPTDIGRRLIEQARVVLAEGERLAGLAESLRGKVEGPYRLGIIPTIAPYLLPLFLKDFLESYPKVQLVVEELQTAEILARIETGDLDAGIAATPLGQPGIVEHPVYVEPFLAYLPKDHPLAKRKQLGEDSLHGSRVWILSEGHCFRSQVLKVCGRDLAGKAPLRFESGNLDTLLWMVDQGWGVTVVPWLAAEQFRARKPPGVFREFTRPVPAREISVIHGRSWRQFPVTDALKTLIGETVPKNLLGAASKADILPVG